MPHFYFNIRNGMGYVPDDEGRELADDEIARAEAVKGARSLLSAEILQGRLDLRGRIEVADGRRQTVMAVAFNEVVEIVDGELPPEEEDEEQAR